MKNEPMIADSTIVDEITTALRRGGDVVTAVTPVVRNAYCNGYLSGFKAGQEDEMVKHHATGCQCMSCTHKGL